MLGNVSILAVYAMIIAISNALSFTAHAGDDFIILREFSQTHCQLLQSASLTPDPTLKKRIEELQNTPNEFSLKTQYENAPNFGFLLPEYWPVMSWAQRVRFNHSISALIKRRLNIPQQKTLENDCQPEIRIVVHPAQEENESAEPKLPQPAHLQAIALMNIRDNKGSKVPLTYIFDKYWNIGWKLDDIIIHTTSIKERDSESLEKIISTSDLDELEVYLAQLLNQQ